MPLADFFVFICLFGNVVFELRLFHLLSLFREHKKGRKTGPWLIGRNGYITLQKLVKYFPQ